MKKLLVSILLLLLTNSLFSQAYNSEFDLNLRQINIEQQRGAYGLTEDEFNNLKGSPYINKEFVLSEVYKGKVKSITNFGAFVEIIPGKDGLLHISEIRHERVEKVEDVLKEGEMIDVKLIAVDPKTGKLKLSRKVLLEKPQKQEA